MVKLVFLTFATIACVSAEQRTNHFEHIPALDDMICPLDDRVFSETSLSKLACLVACSGNSACKSVILDSSVCIGCSNAHFDSSGLDPQIGAQLYNKALEHECTVDACTQPKQICFDGHNCICDHGHKYNLTIQECVTECTSYGNTYQGYNRRRLNIKALTQITASKADCKDACTSNTACRSFNFRSDVLACHLHNATYLERPAPYDNGPTIYTHFVRNCG